MGSIATVLVLIAALQSTPAPPAYPRPGTVKLFENDRVVVWDVAWLKQQYALHTHLYDLVGVSYTEGDRIIVRGDGRRSLNSTKAWTHLTQRAGVTHMEEGASDPPMKAVLIELKRPKSNDRNPSGSGSLRERGGAPAFENERALVWSFRADSSDTMHRHAGEAVEVIFDGADPRVIFVESATVHPSPTLSPPGRAFVFEVK